MTFIDTQPRPRKFSVTYDRGSNDYIVTCIATNECVRFETQEECEEHITNRLKEMHSKPASLPKPMYGFGNGGIGRGYAESRKRSTEPPRTR